MTAPVRILEYKIIENGYVHDLAIQVNGLMRGDDRWIPLGPPIHGALNEYTSTSKTYMFYQTMIKVERL